MRKTVLFLLLMLAPSQMIGAVVTSGFAEWSYSGDRDSGFDMTIEGPRLRVQGGIDTSGSRWPGATECNPCEPGKLVNATAYVSGHNLFGVFGAFGFEAADKILVSGPGQFEGTFDFSGLLCTAAVNPEDPFCAKFEPLTGRGKILLEVFQWPDDGPLQIGKARYTFVIPEPSTYLLVAPCLTILAGWYFTPEPDAHSQFRANERR